MPWQRDMNHPSLLISYRQRKMEVTSTLDTFIFCFHYTVDDCSQILLTWFVFPIKHEKTPHAWPHVSNSVLNISNLLKCREANIIYHHLCWCRKCVSPDDDRRWSAFPKRQFPPSLTFSSHLRLCIHRFDESCLHTVLIWSVNAVKMFQQWRLY